MANYNAKKNDGPNPLVILLLLLLLGVGGYFIWKNLSGSPQSSGETKGPQDSSSASDAASSQASLAPELTPDEAAASSASAQGFSYLPIGEYRPALWKNKKTGFGYVDQRNWSPEMCFPVTPPAYANSQVFGPGGFGMGRGDVPGGYSSDPNFKYPWADNFCEERSWQAGYCNGGKGHVGQDIRPATNQQNLHWAVATEDVVFVKYTSKQNLTVRGKNPPHRLYLYLHLEPSTITINASNTSLKAGEKIGKVSNVTITPAAQANLNRKSSVHLHFEMKVAVAETLSDGRLLAAESHVAPYPALVLAYQRLLGNKPGHCTLPS